MNNQLNKLVADFGGTHLRIGVSNGLEINNISKIRYDNEDSSIKLISNYINDFKDIDQIRICAAGPIENEKIKITNSNLVISKKEISEFSKIDEVAIFK
jgi:Glucokinase